MTDANLQSDTTLKSLADGPASVSMLISSKKIANDYLRKFFKFMLEKQGKSIEEALNIFLDLDYLVEKNGLNDKVIEKINQSPELINLITESVKEQNGSTSTSNSK